MRKNWQEQREESNKNSDKKPCDGKEARRKIRLAQ